MHQPELFLDEETQADLQRITMEGWYPLAQFDHLLERAVAPYADPGPVLEQIGVEIAQLWYGYGPGRALIVGRTLAEFLAAQTVSQGYYSIVKGDPADIGVFQVIASDLAAGTATLHSTTPFNKHMERGVVIGTVRMVEGVVFADADNTQDPTLIQIEYH